MKTPDQWLSIIRNSKKSTEPAATLKLIAQIQADAMASTKTGKQLKDKGIARVATNNAEWLAEARAEARKIAIQSNQDMADIDMLRKYFKKQPKHPNAWGAVFTKKDWVVWNIIQSDRPSSHYRKICLWKLK